MMMPQITMKARTTALQLACVLFGIAFTAADRASSKEPDGVRANANLADVLVAKGRAEVLYAISASDPTEKEEFQKKARGFFAEAGEIYQADHDRFKKAY